MPLTGTLVLDTTRMLPGAVLARLLLDLGARVVKVERPAGGDMMRHIPPRVDGTGAGFAALHRGAESVALNLSEPGGQAALRRLARHADVLVESFRPGTMARWELGWERLRALNPALVLCSLPAFASAGPDADRVAHDLNVVAASGLLAHVGGRVPGVQLADVGTALLASSALLAALLQRARTGRGMHVEQPLATAPLPFLAWARADAAAGGGEARDALLGGRAPAYRLYACGDGLPVALGALEPKFWTAFLEMTGLPELQAEGLDAGEPGVRAAERVAQRLAEQPREHWLREADARGIPLSPVHGGADAGPGGEQPRTDGWLPSFAPAAAPAAPVPRAGEHTERVLREFGANDEEIADVTGPAR